MMQALIMAGGRSERMRASFGPTHKALVPVLGVPLIERNLTTLLTFGARDITVAVSHSDWEISSYVATRGQRLADEAEARLELLRETAPLGTIGAAGAIELRAEALVIINVDNLTSLNLREFVNRHLESQAVMTVATHFETFQIPFGEVILEQDDIVEYREKPRLPVCISSGTYVLSRAACELIPRGERLDIPALFNRVREHGGRVVAFPHEAAWIDVNDADAVRRAEALIAKQGGEFHEKTNPRYVGAQQAVLRRA
jgi:NDP-sugar pyrophosphorylase family protein